MTKHAIIHIGLNKSGTSTLQKLLHHNDDALRAQGILYPRTGRENMRGKKRRKDGRPIPMHMAHHQLAVNMRHSTPGLYRLMSDLSAEIAPFDRVILSSESFALLPDPMPLRHALKGYHTTAIMYLREPGDHALSAYAQRIQATKDVMSFEAFLATFRPDLARIKNVWGTCFDRVLLRPFAPGLWHNQDLVSDFCAHIGIDETGLERVPSQNPTISGNLLHFKLMVNLFAAQMPDLDLQSPDPFIALSELSQLDPRYRGKFFVPDEVLDRYRKVSTQRFGKLLFRDFPDMPVRSFADAPPMFQPAHWTADLDRFLATPPFDAFRTIPPFGPTGITTTDAAPSQLTSRPEVA